MKSLKKASELKIGDHINFQGDPRQYHILKITPRYNGVDLLFEGTGFQWFGNNYQFEVEAPEPERLSPVQRLIPRSVLQQWPVLDEHFDSMAFILQMNTPMVVVEELEAYRTRYELVVEKLEEVDE